MGTATELELVMSVGSWGWHQAPRPQKLPAQAHEGGCSQRRAAARFTSMSSPQEQTSSHER